MATEPLATVEPPTIPTKGRLGFQEAMGIRQPYLQRKAELLPQISEAKGEVAQAKQAQAETLATGKEQAMQQFAGAERGAKEAYQQKLEAEPLPAFVPTKDTVQDIAQLFSLIGVLGMVAGKSNAIQAMNAMNGMLEGHRKGRKDLYQQERQTFEKNFQSMLKKHEEFRKEMEDAVKLAATDRDAGMQAAELAAVKAGSTIVQAELKQGRLMDSYKFIDESEIGTKHATEMEAKAREIESREKKEAQRHAELMAGKGQVFQGSDGKMYSYDPYSKQVTEIETGGITLAKPGTQGTGGAMPKDKETNNEHRFRYSALQNVQEVLDELKKPEVRRLIGPQNQFTPDVLLNLQKGFPELAQKLARFQSEEFKIGGKALTASEQKILGPIYNWRGLTPAALEENLKEATRAMGKEQQYLENRYPGLKSIDYGGNIPDANPSAPASGIEQQATNAFGSYDPNKYDYRISPDGRVQRKLKE